MTTTNFDRVSPEDACPCGENRMDYLELHEENQRRVTCYTCHSSYLRPGDDDDYDQASQEPTIPLPATDPSVVT